MNKEEKDVIDFLKISAITKIEKTILSKEDVKYLLNYIDKLQKENEELTEKINKVVLMINDNYRSEWYDDYETIAGLRDDIYDLLMIKYKGVKE